MPKIQYNKTGGKIIFDSEDWLSGINPAVDSSYDQFIGRSLISSTRSINPYYKLGALCPGPVGTAVTNNAQISAVLLNMVMIGGNGYAISSDAKIFKASGTDGALSAVSPFPYTTLAGTGIVGEDIVSYYIGATQYLFYSWYNGTNGDVGRYDLNTTFDNDWLSTVPANYAVIGKSNPLPMKVGYDDCLYIGDGNNLHQLDGQTGDNGTLTKEKLKLPKGYIITSMELFSPSSLAIFAYRNNAGTGFNSSESKCFFWDYVNADPYKVIDLNDNYVRGSFSWKGTIGCFTRGKRNAMYAEPKSKIRLYNGEIFDTLDVFDYGLPVNGGIETFTDHILFNAEGNIFSYGSVVKGLPNTLHFPYHTGTGNASGLLKSVSSTLLVTSYGATTVGLLSLDNASFRTGQVATISAYPDTPDGMKCQAKSVVIEYHDGAKGGLGVNTYIKADIDRTNSQLTASLANVIAGTTNTPDELIKTYRFCSDGSTLPFFQSLAFIASWSTVEGNTITDAPKIKRVIINFDYTETIK